MKRLGSAILAVVVCSLFFTSNASAWWTETHVDITKKSVKLLSQDQRSSANLYTDRANLHYLYTGCWDPDEFEAINGTHFYVCPEGNFVNNGQYFKNACNYFLCQAFASTDVSARTRFEEHYENALNEYKAENIENAFLELGRACHYIQDIACTPHSAGIRTRIIRVNVHEEYEKYADLNFYILDNAQTASETYDYMRNNSIGIVLNELSMITSSYKDYLLSVNNSMDECEREYIYNEVARATLPIAQKYTAAVLDMFANDVLYCTVDCVE